VKAVLFGATGMVGQGVLRECLLDPGVEYVLIHVVRNGYPKRILETRDINQAYPAL